MLNHWVGIGRLCADPDCKYTNSGKAVTTFRLAVNNGKKADGSDDTLFVTVVCWEKLAESVANYLQKSRLVAVVGKWTNRTYDANDGGKRTVYEVVASQVRFLDKGPDQGGERPTSGPKRHSGAGAIGSEPAFNDDDDVPF